jgi:hypothetical protein
MSGSMVPGWVEDSRRERKKNISISNSRFRMTKIQIEQEKSNKRNEMKK